MNASQHFEVCGSCRGSGEVTELLRDDQSWLVPCPRCAGDGQVLVAGPSPDEVDALEDATDVASKQSINIFAALRDKCVGACYELEAQTSEAATGSQYAYTQMIRWIDELLPGGDPPVDDAPATA